ncbi:alpha/beta hydrolase [Dactylosporangium darangshiense]|uniref:Alpha/beta hydrolase n=1 Tax=Dactylosporangium darangshiense TaxID=579108 RepID=A0ABP8DQM5_9ACTN
MAVEQLEFTSEDIILKGHLRGAAAGQRRAALAITGPFAGVKEQVAGVYAERLAAAGFVTLAFDHRGFGESGGRPAHEDVQGKLADLRAAVGALAAHPAVDTERIGVLGVCLGGGYALRAAAEDPRVRAVAGIAGGYNSPAFFARDPDAYRATLAALIGRYDEHMPAVAPDGGEAAMSGEEPYSYYGNAEHWRNEVTRGSLHSLLTFDALGAAALLARTPLLVVHGRVDAYCSPELASAAYEAAPGPKRFEWIDCERHVDLYDQEPYVTQAAGAAAAFFAEYL